MIGKHVFHKDSLFEKDTAKNTFARLRTFSSIFFREGHTKVLFRALRTKIHPKSIFGRNWGGNKKYQILALRV